MSKTVKEHTEEANALVEHVKDANALLNKLQRELYVVRSTLEWMSDFAPQDWVKKSTQYQALGDFQSNMASMQDMLKRRIDGINALLGDRA